MSDCRLGPTLNKKHNKRTANVLTSLHKTCFMWSSNNLEKNTESENGSNWRVKCNQVNDLVHPYRTKECHNIRCIMENICIGQFAH
jgi:hypothetical protein